MLFFLFSLDGDLLHNIGMKDTVRGSNQRKVVGVVFPTCIISLLFRKIFLATLLQKIVTAEEKMPYEGIYHAGKEAYLQVIAMEKRETDSMRFLEDEQKQRTAMELLEQYMQFKQEAEKDGKKNKLHIPPFGPFFFLVWLLMCFIHVHRKEKDPLKPKHPMSAYLLFTNDRRAALAAENNNLLEVIACHPCL